MDKQFQEIVFQFIKSKSYTGQERSMVEVVKKVMESLNYDEIIIDDVGNIIGSIHGLEDGPAVLFDGHIDTVESDNFLDWAESPFSPYIADGKLFGRGASDMKGAFAAMVFAAGTLERSKLKGSVYVSGTVHEETAEGCSINNVLDIVKPDVVVIGEATELRINIGQRGRGEIVLETYGKSAHSSNPNIGINSILKMNKALLAIKEKYVEKEDILGKGILVLTDIISMPYPGQSVIPRMCKATFDRRLLLGETRRNVLEGIESVLEPLKEQDSEFFYKLYFRENNFKTYAGFSFSGDKFYLPWKIDEKDRVVVKAKEALTKAGIEPDIGVYSFCTNGSTTCGERGIKTIGFGPGREQEAHIANEFVSINDLEKSIVGYRFLALGLTEKGEI